MAKHTCAQSAPTSPHALLQTLEELRAKGDPILTESLLAYPEDLYYDTHDAPQKALLALSEILHSHAQATFAARLAGASTDAFFYADPTNMAYLLSTIARGMEATTYTLDHALQLRELHNQIREE